MSNPQTKRERVALLKEWKRRLGLNDWSISLRPDCDPSDLGEEQIGQVRYLNTNKHATIYILDKKYLETPSYYDFERTLVHELLHVKVGIVYDNLDGVAQDLLHQHINDLSIALVAAKRGRE
jgi:hypothetical protein